MNGSEEDFYDSYEKTLHVLSDEYKGYLKDEETAAKNHQIYQKAGKDSRTGRDRYWRQSDFRQKTDTILGKYDETEDLKRRCCLMS